MSRIRATITFLLGLMFVASGGLKSIDAIAPMTATAAYGILPPLASVLLGALLPAVEVVLGVALLVGYHRGTAMIGVLCLGLLFAVANGLAIARGILVDCHCFGGLYGTSPAVMVAVDVLVVALASIARGGRRTAAS